jgi:nucleotide-binding universal stress UspA family protein
LADRYPDLEISAAMTTDDPTPVMIDESHRAELVVVGGRPPTEPGRSAVAEVATRAECPVIVAPGREPPGPAAPDGPVVVGVKGPDWHASAVVLGLQEAALHGVPLQLVHVWSNIPDMELASVDPYVYDLAEARRDADRLIAAELDSWAEKYPEVPVQRIPIYRLDVAATLRRTAARASLLVLGSPRPDASGRRGLGPIRRTLIDDCQCPVALAR